MLKQLLFGGESGLSPLTNAGFALLRIFAGIALSLGHGWGKIPPSPGLVERTGTMGFPMPEFFAWSAAMAEFVGGLLLALGLFTRISGFFIAFTMLVALFGVHFSDPFNKQELAFLYLFIAISFILKGAGDWSLDGFVRDRLNAETN